MSAAFLRFAAGIRAYLGQCDWNHAVHTAREIFETVAMKEAAN
jgi:hypothetical protein